MPFTPEQSAEIKKQILQQVEQLPQENKEEIKEYIKQLNEEQLEEFLKQNKMQVSESNQIQQEGKAQSDKPIFQSIIQGEIPSYKIAENNKSIALLEINPLSKGHSIVLPKQQTTTEKIPKSAMTLAQKIAKKITIIPMAFGTVFKDQEILETILSKSYRAVKQTLALIDGKIELGVKVVKNKLDDVNNGVALEILESLNKLSIKSVKGDNFSDRLLLNHSFLVEKNKFSKFSEEIAKLEKKHNDLKFLYTGPWPPYSFVNIKIAGS